MIRLLAGIALPAAMACLPAPVWADSLRSALIEAYRTNPTLQAARASQRALDESVPINKAEGLPDLAASTSYSESVYDSNSASTAPQRQLNGQLSLDVPVYSGGLVRNSVAAAQIRVRAGQADLRGTESEVFSLVVSAYMDVIANEAVVRLQHSQVRVLETNLRATSDRFNIGDVTRTDVAQSESRLQIARSDARSAESNLVAARERYLQIVGKAPTALESPPPLPNLPADPAMAVAIALDGNPDLLAAHDRANAAEQDIATAGASRLPRVSLFATGNYNDYFGTRGGSAASQFDQNTFGVTAGVRASIPLFQGGRPAAQRRQAQARASASLEQEIALERSIIAQVRSAYSSWAAAGEIIKSSETAVEAAALGLEGVRAENSVGNRTILDILDAEQELLQARVRLVTARRNAYVAGFTLLAAMGKAEARDLGLEVGPLYDPETNYARVRGKWFDWDDDPAPTAQSSRTRDVAAPDANVTGD